MTRTKKPCSVCGRPDVLRRGMCSTHYQRQRVHGDPAIVGTPGRKTPLPGLLAQCGDCGTTVGLVATRAGVWGALAATLGISGVDLLMAVCET